ncbi:MAG: InlB B-repeat-containing protein [Alphaproteobacteria bacterium]|nr:InlB B-repeat-containing protein [Alphaproteobacteria bacterium]
MKKYLVLVLVFYLAALPRCFAAGEDCSYPQPGTYGLCMSVGEYCSINEDPDGICEECTNKPANSYYTGPAPNNEDACPWECISGYGGDGNSVCDQCLAGQWGPNVLKACVSCNLGYHSAAGSEDCTSCGGTGIYANQFCPWSSDTPPDGVTELIPCPSPATGSDNEASAVTNCFIGNCSSSITTCQRENGYLIGKCYYNATGDNVVPSDVCKLNCNPGSYLESESSCKPCPTGCTCEGGTAGPTNCTVTVTLKLNDGTGTPVPTTHCIGTICTCPVGATCTLPSGAGIAAPTGYAFDGWNANNTGSGTHYGTGGTFNAASEVYIRWKKTVNLDGNGVTLSPTSKDCYHNGNLAFPAIPAPPSGFASDGKWYKNNYGLPPSFDNSPSPVCDDIAISTTFYIGWRYAVTYDGNGATGGAPVPTSTSCYRNAADCQIKPIPAMTWPPSHILDEVYWNTQSNGIGTDIAGGQPTGAFKTSGNQTLYAKWSTCEPGQYMPPPSSSCTDCPIGSYCSGGVKYDCPAATTTASAGSSAKTECRLVQGSKICDGSGVCYTFPDGTNINWKE